MRIVVIPTQGLANRLRAIAYARVLADFMNTTFHMVWVPEAACNCTFDSLFDSPRIPTINIDTDVASKTYLYKPNVHTSSLLQENLHPQRVRFLGHSRRSRVQTSAYDGRRVRRAQMRVLRYVRSERLDPTTGPDPSGSVCCDSLSRFYTLLRCRGRSRLLSSLPSASFRGASSNDEPSESSIALSVVFQHQQSVRSVERGIANWASMVSQLRGTTTRLREGYRGRTDGYHRDEPMRSYFGHVDVEFFGRGLLLGRNLEIVHR